MKIPRDLSGARLADMLKHYGYIITKQTGSHMRLTTKMNGEHHITIPSHTPLKIGTLNAILKDVCQHFKMDRDTLINQLF